MSRHRLMKHFVEEDYYDDYDDYDDDDDYYAAAGKKQQQYNKSYSSSSNNNKTTAATTATTVASKKTPFVKAAATAASTIVKNAASGGIKSAPPGWGKPATTTTTTTAATGAGVSKPPPGWGKPTTPIESATTTSVSSSSSSINKNVTPSNGGISKPPPGWGKPTKPQSTPTATEISKRKEVSAGVMKPPPGWEKPTTSNGSASTAPSNSSTVASNNSNSNSNNNSAISTPTKSAAKTRPLPPILKNAKSQLSMVVLGHVDAGKSTLMGQLLVQVGLVSKRTANKKQLAWLLDEDENEQEHGVTMQIGTKSFTTQQHDIIILDAPGHADFIPIMITGAANADVAILVIAATKGEFETGFNNGQTKEHVILAKGLGVSQVIVAINKLDVDEWDYQRYKDIESQVRQYLIQQQFAPKRIQFVPLSGLTGENVKELTDPKLKQWYKGPTLLEAINQFQPAKRQVEKPLRFAVSDVYGEGKNVIARGRVVQGYLQVGDKVDILPIGDGTTIHKLEHLQPPADQNVERLAIAMAGDTVEIVLTGIDIMRLSVGCILSDPTMKPPICKKAKVKMLVMEQLTIPIIRGAQVIFHMHSLDIPAVLSKLIAITKRDGSIKKERPRALTSGVSAIAEITLSDKICMEPFSSCRALGRFVVRRSGDTIAIGIIDEVVEF